MKDAYYSTTIALFVIDKSGYNDVLMRWSNIIIDAKSFCQAEVHLESSRGCFRLENQRTVAVQTTQSQCQDKYEQRRLGR